MIQHKQNPHIVKSGPHYLQKMTKTQVRQFLKNEGPFKGYLCGNLVNPAHIADGWHLGEYVEIPNEQKFDQLVDDFTTRLTVYRPELGRYAHYYKLPTIL